MALVWVWCVPGSTAQYADIRTEKDSFRPTHHPPCILHAASRLAFHSSTLPAIYEGSTSTPLRTTRRTPSTLHAPRSTSTYIHQDTVGKRVSSTDPAIRGRYLQSGYYTPDMGSKSSHPLDPSVPRARHMLVVSYVS